jgi:hypothetical protein
MGVLSIAWYVGLTIVSENILFDSIAALGLMIAFYYGITGFACTIYYRRQLTRSLKSFLLIGVGPTLGGLMLTGIFVKSCIDLSKPENSESGSSWLGLGPPLVIGVGFLLLGVVLMFVWNAQHPAFFRRKPEVAAEPAEGTICCLMRSSSASTAATARGRRWVRRPGSPRTWARRWWWCSPTTSRRSAARSRTSTTR